MVLGAWTRRVVGLGSVCVDGLWLCRTGGKDRWGGLRKRNGEGKGIWKEYDIVWQHGTNKKIRGETRKKEMRKKRKNKKGKILKNVLTYGM